MKHFLLVLFAFLLSLPGLGQEDEDALIQELEAYRKDQAAVANQINETNDKITESVMNFPEELEKLGHKSVDFAALSDKKVITLIQKAFRENAQGNLSREELSYLILKKYEGTRLHPFLAARPALLNAFSDVLRDQEALPNLLGIFLKKKDLKLYFYIWLGLLVGGWIIKKMVIKKKWHFLKRFFYRLSFSLVSVCLSIGIFYYMFRKELFPTVKILLSHIS